MTDTCVFCKIVSNEAKATIVYRDEQVTAIRDIHPVAPTHILIVPNKHIESVNTLEAEDEQLIGHLFTEEQASWLERLAQENANFDAAVEWGARQRRPEQVEQALRLVGSLGTLSSLPVTLRPGIGVGGEHASSCARFA